MSASDAYDVVVIGAGAGGMTAAVVAAAEGLSVLLIEKTEFVGGTTAWSGGMVWIPGSAAARKDLSRLLSGPAGSDRRRPRARARRLRRRAAREKLCAVAAAVAGIHAVRRYDGQPAGHPASAKIRALVLLDGKIDPSCFALCAATASCAKGDDAASRHRAGGPPVRFAAGAKRRHLVRHERRAPDRRRRCRARRVREGFFGHSSDCRAQGRRAGDGWLLARRRSSRALLSERSGSCFRSIARVDRRRLACGDGRRREPGYGHREPGLLGAGLALSARGWQRGGFFTKGYP